MGFYIFLLENVSCEPSFEPPQQVSYGDGSHFMRILGELVEFQGKQLCHFPFFASFLNGGQLLKIRICFLCFHKGVDPMSLGFIAH